MGGRVERGGIAVVACAVAIGAGMLLGSAGWLEARRTLEYSVLLLAAMAASVLTNPHKSATRSAMPPSFILEFTSLLLFGIAPAVFVAIAGVATAPLVSPGTGFAIRGTLLHGARVIAATLAAGFIHQTLGGTTGTFAWPWQALPIAGAVLGYSIVTFVLGGVVGPLLSREPVERSWPRHVLHDSPTYVIGAGVAVGLAVLIEHRQWEIALVAAVPLYFAGRAYADYARRLDDEHRRREVIGCLDQGTAVLDSRGRVTLWNDALERMVGCPRDRALGRAVPAALPVLANSELARAIDEALTDRRPRTLSHVGLPSGAGARILHVTILPVADGATLLWQDRTDHTRAEHALRRSEERLALAAEGANDGLWEWDLRTQEFYVSGRWRAMLGMPAASGVGRPAEWIDRVHADDAVPLKAALKAHLSGETDHFEFEHRIRHEDGSYRWFLGRGVAVRGAGGRSTRIAGSFTDTTDRAIAQERLRSAGFLDPLTGLRNRADFIEGLGRRLEEFRQRRTTGRFAVLYLDIDRFKIVNDSLGHLVGDELLIAVSRRLEGCLRQGDSLARLGGDEFAILLHTVGDEQQANAIAFRIQEALSAPLQVGGREVFTSASIGIAFGEVQHANPDEIMRDADTAMYHAKSRGKARHELFDADMHARARDRLGLESDLRHAVSSSDFEVYYQPIVSLSSGMCVGFESLIRWKRNGEWVSPATFIPMAEELGLIEPLGTWVLQEACRTFADWKQRFPASGLECITVNASSRQLMQQNFLLIVEQAVHNAQLRPHDLRIEITETALMDSPHVVAEMLSQLRDFGVKIYLDDFGTGYSSLSHLHKLPVDALKIDRSFVRSLLTPDRPAIVESILALARTMNTSVVAEGIESEVQASELERLGCTHAQGFLFSRPLSAQAVEELLTANKPLGPKGETPDTAAAPGPEQNYPTGGFKWPDHIPVGRGTVPEPATNMLANRIASAQARAATSS